jgi:hypothetical protein
MRSSRLSLLSFEVSVMQGSEDWPDFESDFWFLLFWFDDSQGVVEWATGVLLFRFDGRRIGFFFFGLISGNWIVVVSVY